jgi:hypothetical protein
MKLLMALQQIWNFSVHNVISSYIVGIQRDWKAHSATVMAQQTNKNSGRSEIFKNDVNIRY